MQVGLFALFYSAVNCTRFVDYNDSPRAIVVREEATDPDQPKGRPGTRQPDSWPYADGEDIQTFYEQAETVRIYATRTYPFARIEVIAAPPANTCDLDVGYDLTTDQPGFTLKVTTSHGPWSSSLSTEANSFVQNKATYAVASGTTVTVYVRDAAGCQQSRQIAVADPDQPDGPTYAPPGAILLLRFTLPGLQNPDYFRVQEYYYDPATRTAKRYFPPESPDGTRYNRPAAEIIDRWCVDPGAPPYREIQVHHDRQGGIDLVSVDDVAACQNKCTLTLTVTPSAVVDGRGELVAIAAGAQSPVIFSLDDFDTPGLSGAATTPLRYDFENLRPGRYTVYARETRTGGCRAQVTVLLVTSYSARYLHTFLDADNVKWRLRIMQREYTGQPEVVRGQPGAVTLDWPGGATDHVFTNFLRGSECQLGLYLWYREQLLPLFSGDERLHRVELERVADGLLFWKGYLLPEQYDVAFLNPPATFNLSATDGLGTLSDVPFVGSAGQRLRGDWTLKELVLFLLGKLDLDLPLNTLFNFYPSTASLASPAIEQIKIDVGQYADDKGKAWDCGKVLLALLTTFQARLYQERGAWWLERLAELSAGRVVYQSYDPMGQPLADVPREPLAEVRNPEEKVLRWVKGSQRQSLRPAVATITVPAEPGEKVNLLARALPKNTDLPASLPASWSASPGAPVSQLVYQGKDKAPLLRLVGVNTNGQTPELAGWVQTSASAAVPLRDLGAVTNYDGTFTLAFTAKAYGFTPNAAVTGQSTLYFAVKFGSRWLAPYLAFPGDTEDIDQVLKQSYVRFNDSGEIKVNYRGYGTSLTGPQPVLIRFYQPVGGATATTVDISDIEINWENVAAQTADTYTSSYTTDTGQLVSRVDEATTLFHSDTPWVRRQGTLLDGASLPTQGWREAANPTAPPREVGDYVVRDRNLWQRQPAQVLTGELLGGLAGPGVLLTDGREVRPAVYLLTAATYRVNEAQWQIAGAQMRTLALPTAELPEGVMLHEDDSPMLHEDGSYMIYENA
ncbi:hypothetical protein [Hymenobacter sp. BT559]|uniref:hypothetical protein n=1 Tax=Hymenobacter sp. BT559 TaxID=2795729 RepID=UPI0018ECE76C|nr:hypothetical protein [Hymenobacter sp. BT559]MBJ6145745.1 hypothetical protein [Hymenobacter sp. BT559]